MISNGGDTQQNILPISPCQTGHGSGLQMWPHDQSLCCYDGCVGVRIVTVSLWATWSWTIWLSPVFAWWSQPSLLWSAWWSVTRLWFQRAIHIPHSNDVENFNYSILPFIFSHNDCHYHMVSVLSHMYVYKFPPYSCLP